MRTIIAASLSISIESAAPILPMPALVPFYIQQILRCSDEPSTFHKLYLKEKLHHTTGRGRSPSRPVVDHVFRCLAPAEEHRLTDQQERWTRARTIKNPALGRFCYRTCGPPNGTAGAGGVHGAAAAP